MKITLEIECSTNSEAIGYMKQALSSVKEFLKEQEKESNLSYSSYYSGKNVKTDLKLDFKL